MSGELKFILRGYRAQVDILHTLAEGFREGDQWDTGLWLKLVAWLHDLLLERNWLIGKYLWDLQDPSDDAISACIRAPLKLDEEQGSLREVDRLLEQGSGTQAYQTLKMIQTTNAWWRINNFRLLLSHHPEPPVEREIDPCRAFQHVTLNNMFELVPDDGYRPDLHKGKSATEKQKDFATQRKLAKQFEAPEIFLNEERESKLVSIFIPKEVRRSRARPITVGPGAWRKWYKWYLANGITVRNVPTVRSSHDPEGLESMPDEVAPPETIRRTPHLDVNSTMPIQPGSEFQVEVFAAREQTRSGKRVGDIQIAASPQATDFHLCVWLYTSAHFKVVDRPLDKLRIQRQKKVSNRIVFTVRAKTIDELVAIQDHLPAFNRGSITAAFSYNGRPCGRVGRIIELDIREQGVDALDQGVTNRAMVPQPRAGIEVREGEKFPDIFVEIKEDEINDGRRFHCKVTTCLEETSKPWNLKRATSEIVSSYMDNFTSSAKAKPQLIAALRGAGINLFQTSPINFKEAFWRLLDSGLSPKTIHVVTEEPHYLWELMVPTRSGEEREPLGVEFTLARWVTGEAKSPPQQIPISDSYVIAPDYSRNKLKFAEVESKMVCEKFNGKQIKPASYENIRQYLQAKKVSLLHFACHGRAKDNDVEQSLQLADGAELTLIELKGDDVFSAYFGSKQPFVFLNACEVGRQQATLSGAGGFPAVLIDLGARAVVAPAWSVKDTIAHEIATEFYKQVEEHPGKPFAAIFQEIRQRAYQKGEDTYAAYCFYGDPFATRQ